MKKKSYLVWQDSRSSVREGVIEVTGLLDLEIRYGVCHTRVEEGGGWFVRFNDEDWSFIEGLPVYKS